MPKTAVSVPGCNEESALAGVTDVRRTLPEGLLPFFCGLLLFSLRRCCRQPFEILGSPYRQGRHNA